MPCRKPLRRTNSSIFNLHFQEYNVSIPFGKVIAMSDSVSQVICQMRERGFEVIPLETAQQAREYLLSHIPQSATVGVGGSMTIRELNVVPALREQEHQVAWHWDVPKEDGSAARASARLADVYLASSNAVTKDGQLVNIDGTGNRVAAMFDGPNQVYLVISHSKLVDGGLNTAIARIKQQACPPNARRLNLNTPCAHTGICKPNDCGDDCMCHIIVTIARPPKGKKITVLLVEETLGY